MMASIPNMRGTPLPVPTAKTAPAGETAPGDFAAQMPAVPAPPTEAISLLPEDEASPIAPSRPPIGELEPRAAGEAEDGGDTPETKAETPKRDEPVPPALVIAFLPVQPVQPTVPGPQAAPAVSADEMIATPVRETPVQAATARPERPACETDAGKPGLPLPAVAAAPKEQADAPDLEAATRELLQRKTGMTRQVATAPRTATADTAKPEHATARSESHAQTPTQTPTQAPSPASSAIPAPAAQLPAPQGAPDQPQPVLVSPMPQSAPAKAADKAEGTRTTELAVERKLDLARDGAWLDRLARDIARATSDDAPLRFRLHPQTLGHLQVELQQGDHGTAVRLTVETEAARQILADAQPRLAAEARAQGVRIAETHVDLSGSGRQAPGDQRRQDEARQTPLIRTARGAGTQAAARSSSRARLDRYA